MKKVDVMLIGVQKCGTTTLADWLSKHSEISFCKEKEPDFFSKNKDWRSDIDTYHSLFEDDSTISDNIWMEASTTYSWLLEYPEVASRILEYNKNTKFIFIMRNPIERIKSHYIHHRLKAYTTKPFELEVQSNPTYIAHSRYAIQIRPFLELFPKENFHFLTLESLKENPYEECTKISRFIGINNERFSDLLMKPKNQSADLKKVRRIKKQLTPFARLFPIKFRNYLRKPFYYKTSVQVSIEPKFKNYLLRFILDDINEMEKISGLLLKNQWGIK